MKLTAKQILFLLMSTLLVLTIVMGCIVLNRVSGMLQLGGIGVPGASNPVENPSSSESIPGSSSATPSSSQQETTIPHTCEFTIKGDTLSPTCDTLGYTMYYCECGRVDIQNYEPALGHEYGEATVVAATCDTDGYTERICSRCNKAERTELVPASHSFGDWSSNDTATQETRTCSTCKAIEIRNLDTPDAWVIRRFTLEPIGVYTCYKIVVDLPETDTDPTYELYIGLPNKNLSFDYDQGQLTISYIAVGEEESYKVPTTAEVLTIYADGTVAEEKPESTEDPTPSTGPATNPGDSQPVGSQPSSQPASQPESQPGSQPGSQPDSQPSSSGPADEQNN